VIQEKTQGRLIAYRILGGALAAGFILSPAWTGRLDPNHYAGGRSQDPLARRERNASAIGIMLGEFRTGLSDILLIKTERYLHSGVGYIPHIDENRQSTAEQIEEFEAHQREVSATATPEEEHGEMAATLVPGPERDFRSWIGDLQRKVKPWAEASSHMAHTDGRQVLPWFRIATLSDARHVQAYTIGAFWLGRHDREQSGSFLEEGLRNNPDAFQLHLMKGYHLVKRAREEPGDLFDPSPAQRELLTGARVSFRRASDLAMAARPRGGPEEDPAWGGYDEQDAWAAFRMAVLTERYYGDPDRAVALARWILDSAGPDPTLERVISQNPTSGNESEKNE